MKKIFFFVVLSVIVGGFSSSAAADFDGFRGKVQFDTKHIGDFNGTVCSDEPVIAFDVGQISKEMGLFYNVEIISAFRDGSDALRKAGVDLGIEREFYGWRTKLVASYFGLPKISKIGDDFWGFWNETFSPDITLKRLRLNLFLAIERDFPVDAKMRDGGWYWKYGTVVALDGFDWATAALTLGGNDGPFGTKADPLSFARLTITPKGISIGKINIIPEINFQEGLGHSPSNAGLAGDEIWGSIRIPF